MDDSSLMSIGEMIDNAFGEADANIVNFKLIQAVLYLLARQLRILERKVQVGIDIDRTRSGTKLSVTELNIHATVPKKKTNRQKTVKPSDSEKVARENKEDKLAIKSSKSKLIPVTSQKSNTYEKSASKSTEKSILDKSSTTKHLSSSDKTSSDKTKSSEKSSSVKTSTDKTSSDKTSTDKTSTDKTSSDKTSTDKSSSDKTSTDKSSSVKTSTDKSSSGKTSTDKSSSDKTSSDKTSTVITSSDKTSKDKSSTDKTTSSSRKSTSEKDSSDQSSAEKDILHLLDKFEEQRERELRVIRQRADSRDVADKTPTPLKSLDSIEEQYEKLLVVERVPAGEPKVSFDPGKQVPRLSVVTQNQFEALANVVRELQSRLGAVSKADFPDNAQLMQDLRKGASLTDAMAALQLSARLDAAEKTLKQMLELVTDLTVRSGLEVELVSKGVPDTKIAPEGISVSRPTSKKSVARKQSTKSVSTPQITAETLSAKDSFHVDLPASEPSKVDVVTPTSVPGPEEPKFVIPVDCITYDDLDKALQSLTEEIVNTLKGLTSKSNANSENAMKLANRLEQKLESSLNLGTRMNDLEILVSEYSDQINLIDTTLSSQMTNYQEQLTQMQHDLEAGLESMAEALANTGGDTAAVAELNAHFTNLQNDIENTNIRQKDLKESQDGFSLDLQDLWRQIELLRESKADRDEVVDALRDKAGLGALNGLVSLQQFHAVRGDFEKRIGAAYDKFNNQEITWQKAIDDLLRELNDKADFEQLVALRDEVNKNLTILSNRTHAMLEIVGEPRTAAAIKKLFRDAACLSCSSPAHMDLEEPNTIPQLPAFPKSSSRPPTIGAEDPSKPAEDGDHNVCYPGLPIPHPRDPRSHICQRYCGGSHTLVTDKKSRAPVGMIITPMSRGITKGIGSDGRMYMIEDTGPTKKPCIPCNEQKICTPRPSEADQAPVQEDITDSSDMTPQDFITPFYSGTETRESTSMTPPPPNEDF